MKNVIVILSVFIIFGCDKKASVTSQDYPSTNSSGYIEYDPSPVPDRKAITLIRADSGNVTNRNGIYRAPVANPVRYEVFLQENLYSPIQLSSKKFAFLLNHKLNYYSIGDSSSVVSQINLDFKNITPLNDSLLIGNAHTSLYIINSYTDSVLETLAGICPALYTKDTVAMLSLLSTSTYVLELLTLQENGPLSKATVSRVSIDTIFSTTEPLSLGIEPVGRRYCYSVVSNQKYLVFTDEPGSLERNEIAVSAYSSACALSYNKFIYSGEDGRLYETDFEGTDHQPFWGDLDSDN